MDLLINFRDHLSTRQVLSWAKYIAREPYLEHPETELHTAFLGDYLRIRQHLDRCSICLSRVIQEAQAIAAESIFCFPAGKYRRCKRKSNRDCKSKRSEMAETLECSQTIIQFLKGHDPHTPVFIDLTHVDADTAFCTELLNAIENDFSRYLDFPISDCRCVHDYWIVVRGVEPVTQHHLQEALNLRVATILIEYANGSIHFLGDIFGRFIETLYKHSESYFLKGIFSKKQLLALLAEASHMTSSERATAQKRIERGLTMFIRQIFGDAHMPEAEFELAIPRESRLIVLPERDLMPQRKDI